MITSERLTAAKNYMRVDFPDDDALIRSLIQAADNYLENAGIQREYNTAMYDLITHDMVLRMYDRRDSDCAAVSPAARQMINQLKFQKVGKNGASGG